MNTLRSIFLIPASLLTDGGRGANKHIGCRQISINGLRLAVLLFLLAAMMPVAQAETKTDTIFTPSLRLGIDVSGFARQFIETETLPLEFSVDFEWRENFFAAAESGYLRVDVNRDTHRYQAGGYFVRAGTDFNILRGSEHNPNDVLIISLRYGYGKLEHEAPHIVIQDPFWGNFVTNAEKESYSMHWLEAGIGMKAEIWNNFFMGWTLRGRVRLSRTADPNMEPYFVSGFGKSNNTAVMFHYSVYYRIPLK